MTPHNHRRLTVATRSRLLFSLATLAISILVGCGGGSTANVQNPPPPVAASKVSITFQSAPVTQIPVGSTATLTAVVSNDSSNAGVDWSVSCATPGDCGTISPKHTGSGDAATFTPPPSFPGNSTSSNIVAFATADHTQNIQA